MKLTYTGRESFEQASRYWSGRYECYLKDVMQYIQGIERAQEISKVLEIGSYDIPLVKESDTMDIQGYPTYKIDLTKTPWPIADKQYDLAVGCQVWEHLEGHQLKAFQELKRVSKRVLLTLPYMWAGGDPKDCHYMIDMEKITSWTVDTPNDVVHLDNDPNHRRILMYWEF